MNKFSLFKNSYAEVPAESLTPDEFVKRIKEGHWKKLVLRLRDIKDLRYYKKTKEALPGVTVSGDFKTRDKYVPVSERIKKHSGLIALDIDKKDNIKMNAEELIDPQCFMQYVSCSGEGIKIIYRCETTKDPAVHRRIYDAAVQRLEKKGIKLKVDPIVKNIASLQYVSYDPDIYYFPKTKLVIKPLPAIKIKKAKPSEDQQKDLEQLNEYIAALGDKDVTKNYEDWLTIGMGLSYSLGEAGREPFHALSKNYKEYDEAECNEKYDALLERDPATIDRPTTLASVYNIINDHLPKVALRHLVKKYNKSHAVGVGEDTEQDDLAGMVRYRLFLFKKIFDKETNTLLELTPWELNLNAFEDLLKQKGFFRYEGMYVHIKDNIVERVDDNDILRIVTSHIEQDGDYNFTYKKTEFHFSWEELVHLWRKIRGQSSIYNQIAASLSHWKDDQILKDTAKDSYIPYLNGVVHVNAKTIELLPYSKIGAQIWKERILPREFKLAKKMGMFEHFFANVCGRGKDLKQRMASEPYKRALWYYGYMLQGTKRQSTSRAWLLYDIKTGNNGRSGKTIIGQAIGKIRSMVVIDGKQIDLRNRFALQTILPWTDVVFIDDPFKQMSLVPFFNMISGNTVADRKNKEPLERSLKYMIASNWILEAEGTSETGRQFVTQLDDFYVRYGKEHGDTIAPIVHMHGKEFFTDWDATDWSQFDTFSMQALQYHLKAEAPKNTIIGSALLIRFIQLHEEELFFELANAFCGNTVKSDKGGLMIGQQVLTNVIREHNESIKSNKAGKIARDFLTAIGAQDIQVTTIRVAGMAKMAYKIKNEFKDLNFGEYAGRLAIKK